MVVFVDAIDTVRSLSFSTDAFFAGIRQCYVGRAENPRLQRLCFCLLGTATPADLVADTRTTPFNIGRRIEVQDFTAAEAAPLAQGLGERGTSLLSRVLSWTGGHPYLTQRLCRSAAEAGATGSADVNAVSSDGTALMAAAMPRECADGASAAGQERRSERQHAEPVGAADVRLWPGARGGCASTPGGWREPLGPG